MAEERRNPSVATAAVGVGSTYNYHTGSVNHFPGAQYTNHGLNQGIMNFGVHAGAQAISTPPPASESEDLPRYSESASVPSGSYMSQGNASQALTLLPQVTLSESSGAVPVLRLASDTSTGQPSPPGSTPPTSADESRALRVLHLVCVVLGTIA